MRSDNELVGDLLARWYEAEVSLVQETIDSMGGLRTLSKHLHAEACHMAVLLGVEPPDCEWRK